MRQIKAKRNAFHVETRCLFSKLTIWHQYRLIRPVAKGCNLQSLRRRVDRNEKCLRLRAAVGVVVLVNDSRLVVIWQNANNLKIYGLPVAVAQAILTKYILLLDDLSATAEVYFVICNLVWFSCLLDIAPKLTQCTLHILINMLNYRF